MADALWRKIARRIRRRLSGYLTPEVIATLEPTVRDLRAEMADGRDALTGRLADLDAALAAIRADAPRERAERAAALEGLRAESLAAIEGLRAQLAAERVERDAALVAELRAQAAADRAAWERRLEKLEPLVLEHPDVLAVTRRETPFSSPAVSVVMPTWNRSALIGAAIRSVQAQRFSDWELLVVDDGSSDDTAAVMAEFTADPRVRYLVRPHLGQCAARNHALREARGDLVAYLDSDNVWYPGFLAAAVAAFAADPAVDCLYGAMITDVHRPGERILYEPFDRARLLAQNFIGMSTFMHRRALVARYGAFDEELGSLEDWDLILRYTAHAPAYRLPALAVRYRTLDEKRVSVAAAHDVPAWTRIRSKWGLS